jgi:hypothetical protein
VVVVPPLMVEEVAVEPFVVIERDAETIFPGIPPVTDKSYVVPGLRDNEEV